MSKPTLDEILDLIKEEFGTSTAEKWIDAEIKPKLTQLIADIIGEPEVFALSPRPIDDEDLIAKLQEKGQAFLILEQRLRAKERGVDL